MNNSIDTYNYEEYKYKQLLLCLLTMLVILKKLVILIFIMSMLINFISFNNIGVHLNLYGTFNNSHGQK
jgi:hypothetical protein